MPKTAPTQGAKKRVAAPRSRAQTIKFDDPVQVDLPSGGKFTVLFMEQDYFVERVNRYMTDHHFTSVSDLQELDRILILELLIWRQGVWLSRQTDYWSQPVDEREMNKTVKEMSTELRQIKSALGIDKVTRDKVRGEDSVSKYLENLKIRAREFGVHRENQLAKALELQNELEAKMTLHDNCTPDERQEIGITTEDFVHWIRTVLVPQFKEIDEHFRTNTQRFWIREM